MQSNSQMQMEKLRLTRVAHGLVAGIAGGAGLEESCGDRAPTREALSVKVCAHTHGVFLRHKSYQTAESVIPQEGRVCEGQSLGERACWER